MAGVTAGFTASNVQSNKRDKGIGVGEGAAVISGDEGCSCERTDAWDGQTALIIGGPTQCAKQGLDMPVDTGEYALELGHQGLDGELNLGEALLQLLAGSDDGGASLEQRPQALDRKSVV